MRDTGQEEHVATLTARRGTHWGMSLAIATMLALTACGDDGEGPFSTSDAGEISHEQFQERAGGACSEFFSNIFVEFAAVADPITGEPPRGAEQQLGASAANHGDQLLEQLQSIGAPEGHVDEWTEWTGLLEDGIDEMRQDPGTAFRDEETERGARIDELSRTLGVPECAGEGVELSDEAAEALATLMATAIQAQSGGLITDGERDCIADGLFDFAPNLLELQDVDFDDMPAEQQGAFVDVLTGCVPTEKLMQLDDM
jgi:hypothetical protein